MTDRHSIPTPAEHEADPSPRTVLPLQYDAQAGRLPVFVLRVIGWCALVAGLNAILRAIVYGMWLLDRGVGASYVLTSLVLTSALGGIIGIFIVIYASKLLAWKQQGAAALAGVLLADIVVSIGGVLLSTAAQFYQGQVSGLFGLNLLGRTITGIIAATLLPILLRVLLRRPELIEVYREQSAHG